MEKDGQGSIPQGNNQRKKMSGLRKINGLSLVASVLLPMLAAYIVFFTGLGIPSETINQGELLQPPINLGNLPFIEQGQEVSFSSNDFPKWRYLILSHSGCGKECEQLLYTSRQVHIRLGEKAQRVERFLVASFPLTEDRQEQLKIEHPRLKILHLSQETLLTLQKQTAHQNVADIKAVLIDQEGFAMMAYDNQHSGNQLLKDIKRLLKYSYEK